MGHTEGVGLLLEVEDVDVHGVEAEGQGEFDELAGAPGKRQADRAEVAEHAEQNSRCGLPGSRCGLPVGMTWTGEYD